MAINGGLRRRDQATELLDDSRQRTQRRRGLGDRLLDDSRDAPTSDATETSLLTDDKPSQARGIEQGAAEARGSLLGAKAIGQQLLGDEEGSIESQEAAEEEFQRASRVGPDVQSLSQIGSVDEFADFIIGGSGRILPSAGMAAAGAAAGAAVGGPAGALTGAFGPRGLVQKGVTTAVKRSLRRKAGQKAGRNVGLAVPSVAQESGAIFGEAAGADSDLTRNEQALSSIAGGTLAGALDVLPQMRVLKRTLDPDTFKAAQKSILREVGTQSGIEAGTEATQELIAKATNKFIDDNVEIFNMETLDELGTAAALGAIGGGTIGTLPPLSAKARDFVGKLRDKDGGPTVLPGDDPDPIDQGPSDGDGILAETKRALNTTNEQLAGASERVKQEVQAFDRVVRAITRGGGGFERASLDVENPFKPGTEMRVRLGDGREFDGVIQQEERANGDKVRFIEQDGERLNLAFNGQSVLDEDAQIEEGGIPIEDILFSDPEALNALEEIDPDFVLRDDYRQALRDIADSLSIRVRGGGPTLVTEGEEQFVDPDEAESEGLAPAEFQPEVGDDEAVPQGETGVRTSEGDISRRQFRAVTGSRVGFPAPFRKPTGNNQTSSLRKSLKADEELISFDTLIEEAMDTAPAQRNARERDLVGSSELNTAAAKRTVRKDVADRLIEDLRRRAKSDKQRANIDELAKRTPEQILSRFETAQRQGALELRGEVTFSEDDFKQLKRKGQETSPPGSPTGPLIAVKDGEDVRLDPRALIAAAINSNPRIASLPPIDRLATGFSEGVTSLIDQGFIDTIKEPSDSLVMSSTKKGSKPIIYGQIRTMDPVQRALAPLREEFKAQPKAKRDDPAVRREFKDRAEAIKKRVRKEQDLRQDAALTHHDLSPADKKAAQADLREHLEMSKKDPSEFVRRGGVAELTRLKRLLASTELAQAEQEVEFMEQLLEASMNGDEQATAEFNARGGYAALSAMKKIIDPQDFQIQDRVIYESSVEEAEERHGNILPKHVYPVTEKGEDPFSLVEKALNSILAEIRDTGKQMSNNIAAGLPFNEALDRKMKGLRAKEKSMRQTLQALANRSLSLSADTRARGLSESVDIRTDNEGATAATPASLRKGGITPTNISIEEHLFDEMAKKIRTKNQLEAKLRGKDIKGNKLKEGKPKGEERAKVSKELNQAKRELVELQREAYKLTPDEPDTRPLRVSDLDAYDPVSTSSMKTEARSLRDLRRMLIRIKSTLDKSKSKSPQIKALRNRVAQMLEQERRIRSWTNTKEVSEFVAEINYDIETLQKLVGYAQEEIQLLASVLATEDIAQAEGIMLDDGTVLTAEMLGNQEGTAREHVKQSKVKQDLYHGSTNASRMGFSDHLANALFLATERDIASTYAGGVTDEAQLIDKSSIVPGEEVLANPDKYPNIVKSVKTNRRDTQGLPPEFSSLEDEGSVEYFLEFAVPGFWVAKDSGWLRENAIRLIENAQLEAQITNSIVPGEKVLENPKAYPDIVKSVEFAGDDDTFRIQFTKNDVNNELLNIHDEIIRGRDVAIEQIEQHQRNVKKYNAGVFTVKADIRKPVMVDFRGFNWSGSAPMISTKPGMAPTPQKNVQELIHAQMEALFLLKADLISDEGVVEGHESILRIDDNIRELQTDGTPINTDGWVDLVRAVNETLPQEARRDAVEFRNIIDADDIGTPKLYERHGVKEYSPEALNLITSTNYAVLSPKQVFLKNAPTENALPKDSIQDTIDRRKATLEADKTAVEELSAALEQADQALLNLAEPFAERLAGDRFRASLDSDENQFEADYWRIAKQRINEYLNRAIGKNARFKKDLFLKGRRVGGLFDKDEGIIYVAYTATNPYSVAHHESLHYAFHNFLTPSQKEDLTAFFGKNRNRDRLIAAIRDTKTMKEGSKEKVIEVISDDSAIALEERVAYGYQMWMRGEFKAAPSSNAVFTFIRNLLRDMLGILSKAERSDLIFKALRDGDLYRATELKTPWKYPGIDDTGIQRGMRVVEDFTKNSVRPLMVEYVWPVVLWGESHSNPVLRRVIRQFSHNPLSGEPGTSYMEAKGIRSRKLMLKWYEGTGWGNLTPQQRNAARDAIYAQKAPEDIADRAVSEYVAKWRKFMDDMHRYMNDTGLEVAYLKRYFPRVWDPLQMHENKEQLMRIFRRHEAEIKKQMDMTPEELFDAMMKADGSETALPDILVDIAEKKFSEANLDPALVEELREKSVTQINRDIARMGREEDQFLREGNEEEFHRVAKKKQAYEFWANNTLGTFLHAPGSRFTKARTLKFLDEEDLGPFLQQDFHRVMSQYIISAVKRAEFARRFGKDGRKLREQMAEMRSIGLSAKDEEMLSHAISAMRGTLGTNMNPRMRKWMSNAIVFQNLRLLSLTSFTALVDVPGILMRSQDTGIFWKSLKVGFKQIAEDLFPRGKIKAIKKRIRELERKGALDGLEQDELNRLRTQRSEMKSQIRLVAEEMATIESSSLFASLQNMYGNEYLYSKAEHANSTFFKWIGLEYVTNITRIMATSAALSFIKSHAMRAGEGNAQSKKFLKELNLELSDIVLDDEGELVVGKEGMRAAANANTAVKERILKSSRRAPASPKKAGAKRKEMLSPDALFEDALNRHQEKFEVAINRFVDQSVPRPNAGDRPAQMSNPHLMLIAHLKSFIFTFQTQMLNRVGKEGLEGNVKPAIYLMSAIPVIMAMDGLRHTIQYWWDDPEWDDDWTAADHVFNGAQRAGLFGMTEFAVETKQNLDRYRGTGVEALLGPTGEHAVDVVRSAITGYPSTSKLAVNSLPLQNLYKNWPIFSDGET